MRQEEGSGWMLVRMELALPRDARYVRVLRDVARCVLNGLGAPARERDDIELAITEGCSNAVRHARGAAEYEVRLSVSVDGCEVEIADLGPGLDGEAIERAQAEDESGRGLLLMEALVDELQFVPQDQGTRLRLHKGWTDLAPDVGAAAGGRQARNGVSAAAGGAAPGSASPSPGPGPAPG